MIHNFNNFRKFPIFHVWQTSNRMNVFSNDCPIKEGDTIVANGQNYKVSSMFPENYEEFEIVNGKKIPLKSFKRKTQANVSSWIVEDDEKAYVTKDTKYYEFTYTK